MSVLIRLAYDDNLLMSGRKHLEKRSPWLPLVLVLLFLLYLGFRVFFWVVELALLVKVTLNPPLVLRRVSPCGSVDQSQDSVQARRVLPATVLPSKLSQF